MNEDKLDKAADSLRRVADGVDGLEKRLRKDEWSEEARKAAAEARKKGGKGKEEEDPDDIPDTKAKMQKYLEENGDVLSEREYNNLARRMQKMK